MVHSGTRTRSLLALALALATALLPLSATARGTAAQDEPPTATLAAAQRNVERALEQGNLDGAAAQVQRALERDVKSIRNWELRAMWAEAADNRDELIWSLHRQRQLVVAQGLPKRELAELDARLAELDPFRADLDQLGQRFLKRLEPIADAYEKEDRPHAAISVHKEILTIDPERAASLDAIQRLANSPDPSLAGHAKPRDLLADVSAEWIAEHDDEHREWEDRATLVRDNYRTITNAGYEVLVRSGEAMEQMNAFYRQFFRYATEEDGGSVSRIDVRIFKTREQYLDLGQSPAEWSGGQFTGDAVETYIGSGGFEGMSQTLFHEAAHQFVSLATSASGWLNEGLASFFEGCRILANGTVIMNLPATHRLIPLAARMDRGWMDDVTDGINPEDPTGSSPEKAPTFRILLENQYVWGPPWYAPTWGVVYFLYNYQDPVDGRFVYRKGFIEFIDASGGRMGEGAVNNFEEVVLENPAKPTPGVDFAGAMVALAENVEELDRVWMDYVINLRDEQTGKVTFQRPWLDWAEYAMRRKEPDIAAEHFEKGLIEGPRDRALLERFAEFLDEERDDPDRAAKLQLSLVRQLEADDPVDEEALKEAKKRLLKYDSDRDDLEDAHEELFAGATSIVQRYLADGLPSMGMELSSSFGRDLLVPGIYDLYSKGLQAKGESLAIWQLAYNERDLRGWNPSEPGVWRPVGERLAAGAGNYAPDAFDFRSLFLDTVTSGDFSLEAEVLATSGKSAFAGLVFGRKDATHFHGLLAFPPNPNRDAAAAATTYLDLTTFYGADEYEIWRHNAAGSETSAEGETRAAKFMTLRIDVVGSTVDAWLDGKFIASQTFSNPEVLRGAFGLIIGPGEAEFRNVRYLARDPFDIAAQIERQRRLDVLLASGKGLDGSFLGFVPPLPPVERWSGETLDGWGQIGPHPKVLTLWSVDQNGIMPLHEWLTYLAEEHEDIGLEFISIASANDSERLDAYLETHAFPGFVGVDRREGFGFGDSFETFAIQKFNLPRVLLLGLDDKVVWEGDPGLRINQPWSRGAETYLDPAIQALRESQKLKSLYKFAELWETSGADDLAAGRVPEVLGQMVSAERFAGVPHPTVTEVREQLASLRSSCEALSPSLDSLVREGVEPAFATLIGWGETLGLPGPTRGDKREWDKRLEASGNLKAWERLLSDLDNEAKKEAKGKSHLTGAPLRELLSRRDGRLPGELLEQFDEQPDLGPVALLELAEGLPGRYLAREFFRW